MCAIITQVHAQLRCGTTERYNFEMNTNKDFSELRKSIENNIKKFKKSESSSSSITIPVVFHVLYKNEAEYITTQQILSQLDVLNKDFNRTNSDASQTPNEFLNIAADCNISFCLAQRTIENDSTSGITYTQTSINSFSLYDNRIFHDSLGGKTIWNPNHYLNIYVCDLNSALGFSSFPGSSENRDAVVIDFEHFGTIDINPPFNKGRTATHEVGHWLNLLHIWGDGNCGSDQVDDTPVQELENYGCPNHPSPSCNNTGDMFMNFMDYTNDGCMNLFTNGQKERMHATLNTARQSIGNTYFCDSPYEDIGIEEAIYPTTNTIHCGNEIDISISIANFSEKVVNNAIINYSVNDQSAQSFEWSGILSPNTSQNISLETINIQEGENTIEIFTTQPNGFRDLNPNNDTISVTFLVKNGVNFEFTIQTDNYAEENNWLLLNSIGEVIVEENNLESNTTTNFNICQEVDSCYTFILFDSYNDGICCDFGNGYLSINNQIYSGEFNQQLEVNLCEVSTTNNKYELNDIQIYPNPANDLVYIESESTIRKIILTNMLGKNVASKLCDNNKEKLNLYNLKSGSYVLIIITEKGNHQSKIFIYE